MNHMKHLFSDQEKKKAVHKNYAVLTIESVVINKLENKIMTWYCPHTHFKNKREQLLTVADGKETTHNSSLCVN